jgi:hypothetical protein
MAGKSAETFRHDAARLRKLARDITDDRTLKFLTKLADELDASAAVVEAAPASPERPAATPASYPWRRGRASGAQGVTA